MPIIIRRNLKKIFFGNLILGLTSFFLSLVLSYRPLAIITGLDLILLIAFAFRALLLDLTSFDNLYGIHELFYEKLVMIEKISNKKQRQKYTRFIFELHRPYKQAVKQKMWDVATSIQNQLNEMFKSLEREYQQEEEKRQQLQRQKREKVKIQIQKQVKNIMLGSELISEKKDDN